MRNDMATNSKCLKFAKFKSHQIFEVGFSWKLKNIFYLAKINPIKVTLHPAISPTYSTVPYTSIHYTHKLSSLVGISLKAHLGSSKTLMTKFLQKYCFRCFFQTFLQEFRDLYFLCCKIFKVCLTISKYVVFRTLPNSMIKRFLWNSWKKYSLAFDTISNIPQDSVGTLTLSEPSNLIKVQRENC